MNQQNQSALVDINEIVATYLPVSKRKARKFVMLYLETKKIGNRIYVDRKKLEELLLHSVRDSFPLNL